MTPSLLNRRILLRLVGEWMWLGVSCFVLVMMADSSHSTHSVVRGSIQTSLCGMHTV